MGGRRARGEGSIWERPDCLWIGQVVVGPGRKRKTVYGKRRADVARQLAELTHARNQGLLPAQERGSLTVAEWAARWLEMRASGLRVTTAASYAGIIRRYIIPKLGQYRLQNLRPEHVRAFHAEVAKAGVSPRTIRYAATVLKMLLKDAHRLEVVPRNVAEVVRVEAPQVERKVKAWTPADAARFLDAAKGHRLYALWYLMLSTGIRPGETLGLTWEALDLEAGRLNVRTTVANLGGKPVASEPKTPSSRRVVHLSPDVVNVLRAHQAATSQPATGYVFRSSKGGPVHPSNASVGFHGVARAAGVPRITPHGLRHTHASLLLSRGVAPEVVSKRLGHASVGFTMDTYREVYEVEQREAAVGLPDLLAAPGPRAQS